MSSLAGDAAWARSVKCRPESLISFTRQLGAMLRAGIPIARCLETLATPGDDPEFTRVLHQVYQKVLSGIMLSDACASFPKVFKPMLLSMVRVGEKTGFLAESLDLLAGWMERDHGLAKRVQSALVYPGFVLLVAGSLTLALFYWVMPGFVRIFEDMRIPLPILTRTMVAITNAIRTPGFWLLLAGAGLGLYFWVRDTLATEPGRVRFAQAYLQVPVLGPMLRQAALARFCSAMRALLSVGTELTAGLRLALAASGSPLLAQDAEQRVHQIREGVSLSEGMAQRPDLYPATVTQLLAVGEETSALTEMFERLGGFYDQEVEYLIEGLSAVLEPLLLAAVGGVVATIMLSAFLPLYSYLGKLG